jgi:hypothetical protein
MMWGARNMWLERASGKHEIKHIFSMDEDDQPLLDETLNRVSGEANSPSRVVVGPSELNNMAWNRAYDAIDPATEVAVQLSDDFECPDGWDQLIVERFEQRGLRIPQVLAVSEPIGHNPYVGDAAYFAIYICTMTHLLKCGYYLFPEYYSMTSDDDIAQKSSLDGTLVEAFDLIFYHHWHGGVDDPLTDDTYQRHHSEECNNIARVIYEERKMSMFPDIVHGTHGRDIKEDSYFMPKVYGDKVDIAAKARQERGWSCVKHVPFKEGDFRKDFVDGKYAEARDKLVERVLKPHHFKVCFGRFKALGGVFIWNECTRQIGDREPIDEYDEAAWKSYLG